MCFQLGILYLLQSTIQNIPFNKNNFLLITQIGHTRLSNIVKKAIAGEAPIVKAAVTE